ncbi:MAG TPA: hypothetical protein VLH60_01610 [Sedimentisphaerales bacterium]|nr:hypothetical protein [Sedimentisphaerales bacterium]
MRPQIVNSKIGCGGASSPTSCAAARRSPSTLHLPAADCRRLTAGGFRTGSALILTVTISVLLAAISVLFILRTSVDSIGTLAVADNKELSYIVKTVVARLSRELVLDVPGVADQEYHDYPGPDDIWLANLEPYLNTVDGRYYWGQISNLYGDIGAAANDVWLDPDIAVIRDDGRAIAHGELADADGDGIADSKWLRVMTFDDPARPAGMPLRTSRGQDIYLAIRVIDLGGMLNANTAYKFDPADTTLGHDGSSVAHINLFSLAMRSESGTNNIGQLNDRRRGSKLTFVLSDYMNEVAGRLNSPLGTPLGRYSPFGINEELKLRYRCVLNFNVATTWMDNNTGMNFWADAWELGIITPASSLNDWLPRVVRRDIIPTETLDLNDPNKYDYRHITTTFNSDRLIDPNGDRMMNLNRENANSIYERLRRVLPDANDILAQLAVNIKDYRDGDHQVSWLPRPSDPNFHIYGHSSPFMWISELAYSRQTSGDPPVTDEAWAVELYVPQTIPTTAPDDWRLAVGGVYYSLPSSGTWGTPSGTSRFLVLTNDAAGLFGFTDLGTRRASAIEFANGSRIELQRIAPDGRWVTVDHVTVPAGLVASADTPPDSARRDISPQRAIRKVWGPAIVTPTLGGDNGYDEGGAEIQYFTKGDDFTTIGELGNVLIKATNEIGPLHTEADVRFDWLGVSRANVARYFTVMEPSPVADDRIYGRININTAPYFVIAQLPWMQHGFPMTSTDPARFNRARDVVARRDAPAVRGFRSVAEILQAPMMRDLAAGGVNLDGLPDLSPDGVTDDFEERDILFSRISNLATVRSDVFCAYILVRIGEDGPQERVMVILDRSGVNSPDDNVRIRAFHPVPDPR